MKVSIDTNLFIEVKNREKNHQSSKRILDMVDAGEMTCVLSTIVVAEMCAGYHLMGELKEKDDFITHIIASQSYELVELSVGVADEAARVRAATSLKLPDAIIVATALMQSAECVITNDASLKRAENFIKVLTSNEFVGSTPG